MLVLGIDPGTQECGWAALSLCENLSLAGSGVIKAKGSPINRLKIIHNDVADLLLEYDPTHVVLEDCFLSKFPAAFGALKRLQGVFLALSFELDTPMSIMSVTEIRETLGKGTASKKKSHELLEEIAPGITNTGMTEHELDAFAAAYAWFVSDNKSPAKVKNRKSRKRKNG